GEPLEPRTDVPPLGVVIVGNERLARLPGGPGLGAAGLAQTLVAELDPRAAGPFAQDRRGGVPEAPDVLRFAGFGQELANWVQHDCKTTSRKGVTRRRRTEASREAVGLAPVLRSCATVLRDASRSTPLWVCRPDIHLAYHRPIRHRPA